MAQTPFFVLALTVIALQVCVRSQFYRGSGEFLFQDVASDYMYRFRVPVTPKSNFVYAILASTSQLAYFSFDRVNRGVYPATWTTDPIPGLNVSQPTLNVDIGTDRVYFMHPVSGKIYCYDASRPGHNNTQPVWVTPFVCSSSSDERNQQHQAFTANGKRLLARCNSSLLLLSSKGTVLQNYSMAATQSFVDSSDLAVPVPVYTRFTRMLTWQTITDDFGASQSYLYAWDLAAKVLRPKQPKANITLPAGVVPKGVNTDAKSLAVVVDGESATLYLYSLGPTYKLQSSFDFAPLVDPDGELEIRVLPSPAISGGAMYGILQGRAVSLYPWIYPDVYYFWAFAMNVSTPAAPSLLWITSRTNTSGALAPQIPWLTDPAFFITEYQQNATRGFNRVDGSRWFNVPAEPLSSSRNAYSLIRGTYKLSLPWVSRDGVNEVFQYDNGQDDAEPEAGFSKGYIRTMLGLLPFPPPPPLAPSSPAESSAAPGA